MADDLKKLKILMMSNVNTVCIFFLQSFFAVMAGNRAVARYSDCQGSDCQGSDCQGNFRSTITISPGCVISPRANILAQARGISGDVHIGQGCIINPSATIDAGQGSISIGDGNILEDYAQIINRETKYTGQVLRMGNGNIVKSSAIVESHQIGNGNIFNPNSYVGPWVTIGNGCIIGNGVQLNGTQYISDGLVVG